jgi:exonuclease 3'-5' domain-containing protein 1
MELASRTGSRKFVSGLMECIEKESTISAPAKTEWRRTKERVLRLFLPGKGDHNEVLNERPLKLEISQYCKQNVALLPDLYTVYSIKLCPRGQAFWRVHVREATKNRIKLSQTSDYDGKSRSQVLGWDDESIDQAIESWNDDIMMEAMLGENVLNKEDDWVAAPNDGLDEYFDQDEDDHEAREDEWYPDTARDCIGWEEDMIKNGESF